MRLTTISAPLFCLAVISAAGAADAPSVTLTLVGDVMLGRDVALAVQQHSPMYPFEPVLSELRGSDILFGNLECPLTDRTSRFPRVNALHAPPQMAETLAQVGFLAFSNFPYTDFVHDPSRPSLSILRGDRLRECITRMTPRYDIIVASLHWGQEGERATAHLAV